MTVATDTSRNNLHLSSWIPIINIEINFLLRYDTVWFGSCLNGRHKPCLQSLMEQNTVQRRSNRMRRMWTSATRKSIRNISPFANKVFINFQLHKTIVSNFKIWTIFLNRSGRLLRLADLSFWCKAAVADHFSTQYTKIIRSGIAFVSRNMFISAPGMARPFMFAALC